MGVSPTPRPPLPPGKTRYQLYRRLGGPHGRSGRTENLVPTGIRPQTVQHVVSRYTDWATRPFMYIYIYIYIYNKIDVPGLQHSTSIVWSCVLHLFSYCIQQESLTQHTDSYNDPTHHTSDKKSPGFSIRRLRYIWPLPMTLIIFVLRFYMACNYFPEQQYAIISSWLP